MTWNNVPDSFGPHQTDPVIVATAGSGKRASATTDQANPSSVELRPGRYFTITSDPHIAAIVGVYTEKRDYR